MLAQIAAAGGGALPQYIEDVFSTYLYTGNSSTQTITNGIDLAGKGGLTWIKRRTSEAHYLFDTNRGALAELNTDGTDESQIKANSLTSFNTTGFSLGSFGGTNYSVAPDNSYVSWTFRKQPKFFDVVTFTTGASGDYTFNHNLGSVPACVFVKPTGTNGDWNVYHRSIGVNSRLFLNQTSAKNDYTGLWGTPTSTTFTGNIGTTLEPNVAHVAYLFAHDAGGFGLAGTDNVVSCGSLSASTLTSVTLGYEPQWVMVKKSSGTGDWYMLDVMRGMSQTTGFILEANLADADFNAGQMIVPTATGFQFNGTNFGSTSGETFIYIAIRRGPMKVPELGTTVFDPVARAGTGTTATVTGVGFPPDLVMIKNRSTDVGGVNSSCNVFSRLTGPGKGLYTALTNAESGANAVLASIDIDGISFPAANYSAINGSADTYINYFFGRAPGFFDQVCYTGTGVAQTLTHNLAAVPV